MTSVEREQKNYVTELNLPKKKNHFSQIQSVDGLDRELEETKWKTLEQCQARISQLERQLSKAKEQQANDSQLHFRSQQEHFDDNSLADFSVKGDRENCYEPDPVKARFRNIQSSPSIGYDKWEKRRRKGGGSDGKSGTECRGRTEVGGGGAEDDDDGAGGGQGDELEDERNEGKISLLRSSIEVEHDSEDDGERLYSKRICTRQRHMDKGSNPDSDETFNFHNTPGINYESDCLLPIRICEISSTGNYIRLRNTTSQERNIGGHYIVQRREDGGPFLVFRFPSSVPVAPKATVTVWSGSSSSRERGLGPPTDYVFIERQSWLTGSDCTTVLCKPDERALSWLTALGPVCARAKERVPLAPGSGEPKVKCGEDRAQKERREEEEEQQRWSCGGDWSSQTKTPTGPGSSNPTQAQSRSRSRSRSKSRSWTKKVPAETTSTKTKKKQAKSSSTSNSDEEEEEEVEEKEEEEKEREDGEKEELPEEDRWWGGRKTSLDKYIPCPCVHLEDGKQRQEKRKSFVRDDHRRHAVLEYSDSYCPAAASRATKTSGEERADKGLEGKYTSKRCKSSYPKDKYARTMQQVCGGNGTKMRTVGKDLDCPAGKREQVSLDCNNSSRNLDRTKPRECDNSEGRLRGPRDHEVEEGRGWFYRWFKGRPTPQESKQTKDNDAGPWKTICGKRSQLQCTASPCLLPCEQRGAGPTTDCVTELDVRACRSEGDVRLQGCSRCGCSRNDDPARYHHNHRNYPHALAWFVAAGLIVAVYCRQASK